MAGLVPAIHVFASMSAASVARMERQGIPAFRGAGHIARGFASELPAGSFFERTTFPCLRVERVGTIMADIYGLYSARNGRIRYVGQTLGDCRLRFEEHKRSPSPALSKWFRTEWVCGYRVECVLLQTVDNDVRGPAERHWMARFPGLLNERISAQTWFMGACAKPPVIPEVRAYMRRYLFNVGGFRGICYDHHWDRYQVLMYDGRRDYWLFGDECDEMMPGWGGNMWFPDRTAALIARDNARKWGPKIEWPPDLVLPDDELFFAASTTNQLS